MAEQPAVSVGGGARSVPGQRLAISFWIWALWDTGTNGFFNDLDLRMAELVERGFNCVRIEGGAGLTHDAHGRPRGELEFLPAVPGHGTMTRQMEHMTGGRVNLLKRLMELCTAARRHHVKVILSSWYYLHTFWFTDERLTAELLGLAPEQRFMAFARGLDCIIGELEQAGLADTLAFAEIFNELDGMDFIGGYGQERAPELLRRYRAPHEEALAFLRARHPDVLFALDTYTAWTRADLAPRNAQVWNLHNYYLWGVYGVFEGSLLGPDADLADPRVYAPIRRFLRRDLVPFQAVVASRAGRPPILDGWFRRIWLYRNLDPNAMPELERLLQENLERNIAQYKRQAADGAAHAVRFRDEHLPGVPLVLGEGASYCADRRLRWEERSDAYWEVVEHAVRACRDLGFWGTVVRTNAGPEDPVWHEYPERLCRVNAVFLQEGA